MDCSLYTTAPVFQSPSNADEFMANPAKALPLGEAIDLYSGLTTVMDVVGALMCQPRFSRDPGTYNEAGEELEDIWDNLGRRLEGLVTVIRTSRPSSDLYRRKRAAFLATYEIECDGDEADRITDAFMNSPA